MKLVFYKTIDTEGGGRGARRVLTVLLRTDRHDKSVVTTEAGRKLAYWRQYADFFEIE